MSHAVWFGHITMQVRGISTLENTAPATWPEIIYPACGAMQTHGPHGRCFRGTPSARDRNLPPGAGFQHGRGKTARPLRDAELSVVIVPPFIRGTQRHHATSRLCIVQGRKIAALFARLSLGARSRLYGSCRQSRTQFGSGVFRFQVIPQRLAFLSKRQPQESR